MKEYALYKGEEILSMGTIKEIAKELDVKPRTVYFYGTDVYKRRIAKRKKSKNSRILVCLDD